jgi:hypothetical protein
VRGGVVVPDILLERKWMTSLALGLLASAIIGCQAYDPALLEQATLDRMCGDGEVDSAEFCDSGIEPGMPGSCPTQCDDADDACAPQVLVGSRCHRRCMQVRVTTATNGDGCCPEQVSAAEDSDCGFCGDDTVGPAETCDPAASCPNREMCESDDACIAAVFSGDADSCSARCELRPIAGCVDGDGCCPAGCGDATDDDCSANCGDGVVDRRRGETCEPSNPEAPCAERCADEDPCTRDLLVGSARNCNARCTHTAITEPADGDACCPSGAHSQNDSDCAPACGNDVTEAGEECDWSRLCSAECRLLTHASLAHRYTFDGEGSGAEDSVGGADGQIVNAMLDDSGQLRLAGGTSEQYVELPNGIVSGLVSATVETWIAWPGGENWQRIFDFGNNVSGEGAQGGAATSFWFLTVSNAAGSLGSYVNFSGVAGDTRNDANAVGDGVLADGEMHQVVAVFDGEAGSMQLYVDGSLQATHTGLSGRLSDIDDRNAWIGRSNWNDPELAATISEFRIYRAALTQEDVRRSYEVGPDPRR